jgi:hypothetical protein
MKRFYLGQTPRKDTSVCPASGLMPWFNGEPEPASGCDKQEISAWTNYVQLPSGKWQCLDCATEYDDVPEICACDRVNLRNGLIMLGSRDLEEDEDSK